MRRKFGISVAALALLGVLGNANAQPVLETIEVFWKASAETRPKLGLSTGAGIWFPSPNALRPMPYAFPPSDGQWASADDPAPNPDNLCDNPVDIATGRKHESVVDFAHASIEDLRFERTYNQAWTGGVGLLGLQWITNHDLKLSTARWYRFNARKQPPCYNVKPGFGCPLGHWPAMYAHREGGDVVEFIYQSADRSWRGTRAAANAFIKARPDGTLRLDWGDGRTETYTSEGFILTRLRSDGTGLHYDYGTSRSIRIRHTSGLALVITYDGLGRIAMISDPAGGIYRYAYDASNRLASVAFPDGQAGLQYHYDAQGRYVGKSIGGVRFTTYTYDNQSRVVESQKAGGADRIRYAYTADATVRTNALGKQTTFHLQSGRIVGSTGHASARCPATATTRKFDALGQLTRSTDQNRVSTDFAYDPLGRVIRKIEAAGTSVARDVTWEWAADRNRVIRATLVGTSSTKYAYTPDGRLASDIVIDAASGATRTTTYAYTTHANGMLASMTVKGPLPGDTRVYTSSASGDLLQERNAAGHATTYGGHNALGLPARITSPAGAVTEYEYDARGRIVVERTFPSGKPVETRYVYGASGLLDAVQGADGNTHMYHYDAARRLIQEDRTEPDGSFAVRRTTYNAMSQPLRVEVGRDP